MLDLILIPTALTRLLERGLKTQSFNYYPNVKKTAENVLTHNMIRFFVRKVTRLRNNQRS